MSIALKTSLLAALAFPGWGLEAIEVKYYETNDCTGEIIGIPSYRSLKCTPQSPFWSEKYVVEGGNITRHIYDGIACNGNASGTPEVMQSGECVGGQTATMVDKADLVQFLSPRYKDENCTTKADYEVVVVVTMRWLTKCHKIRNGLHAKISCEGSDMVGKVYNDDACSSLNRTETAPACQWASQSRSHTSYSSVSDSCAAITAAIDQATGKEAEMESVSDSSGRSLDALVLVALAAIGNA